MGQRFKTLAFSCTNCGAAFAKWMGKCSSCGEFNSVTENPQELAKKGSAPVRVKDFALQGEVKRVATGLSFLDRVLSSGLPEGTVVLVAGEPGIGKSTLLFQMLLEQKETALYVSAEESVQQVSGRFRSFKKVLSDQLFVLAESHISEVLAKMNVLKPKVVVIDSIQMMVGESEDKARGGMSSLKEITEVLVQRAKELGIMLWIVGHVNKEGEIAGPKTLEHLVDTVLLFSSAEDSRLRILQVQKHRFGRSGEVALLEMSESGLKEQKDAESYWIQSRTQSVAGCAIAPVVLGSRVVCVEIQALVVDSFFPSPRRSTSGFDLNRLFLILAVLEKRLRLPFSRSDVYLNIVGGLKISDPGADMAVAAALVSALNDKAIGQKTVFCGELGLTGELRPCSAIEDRLKTVESLSYNRWIGPEYGLKASKTVSIGGYSEVHKALEIIL